MSAAPRIADTTVGNLARRNPGPNADPVLMAARSLAIEVQASRKLIADLRVEHEYRQGGLFDHCVLCGVRWPCPTIRLIDGAGL